MRVLSALGKPRSSQFTADATHSQNIILAQLTSYRFYNFHCLYLLKTMIIEKFRIGLIFGAITTVAGLLGVALGTLIAGVGYFLELWE